MLLTNFQKANRYLPTNSQNTFISDRPSDEEETALLKPDFNSKTYDLRNLPLPIEESRTLVHRYEDLKAQIDKRCVAEYNCMAVDEDEPEDLDRSNSLVKFQQAKPIVNFISRKNGLFVDNPFKQKPVSRATTWTCEAICADLERHCLTSALRWCKHNQNILTSNYLEFQLKLQWFLELVKEERIKEAVPYCQKLRVFQEYFSEVKRAAVLAVLSNHVHKFPEYQDLLSEDRWSFLQTLLKNSLKSTIKASLH